ncbi:MAG: hypothetical protein HZB38_01940 [Planctomycetes bacterium]|nr:hypothetical protein [Planctomycetota bacterium]
MKNRPFWLALLAAYAAFFVCAVLLMRLAYGLWDNPSEDDSLAILSGPIETLRDFGEELDWPNAAWLVSDGLVYTPAFLVGLLVWAILRKRRHDGYLHCLKCDHILKGLTAPRCPECGEPI